MIVSRLRLNPTSPSSGVTSRLSGAGGEALRRASILAWLVALSSQQMSYWSPITRMMAVYMGLSVCILRLCNSQMRDDLHSSVDQTLGARVPSGILRRP